MGLIIGSPIRGKQGAAEDEECSQSAAAGAHPTRS
jgi:hypothetical protein